MKMLSANEDSGADLSPDAVAQYLQQHPDFFLGRENLLVNLELPHQEGQSVSLVQRQMAVLREKNTELRHRLEELLATARQNDLLFGLCRRLTLSLLESHTLAEFLDSIENSLVNDFHCDRVSLVVDAANPVRHSIVLNHSMDTIRERIAAIAKSRKPVLGAMRPEELSFLFPGAEDAIRSAAAVPLHGESLDGILAVGSSDPLRFGPDLDTLFLDFIAEVIRRLLPRFS